ncbi:hypothetical protein [Microbulbifer halophilus]|uniref:Uncharacterized protein n=1 Tax=Microbulbifer halophilus TaxID=453963 RepID=A0ABW5EE75_9GAMM|nr:hypothetical protein [Microbulbifer halophilus]MCW8127385.1 hypothetical protein [Microbulbifer halophilus]
MPISINQLEELRPDSGKRILGDLRGIRLYLQSQGRDPVLLIKPKQVANMHWEYHLTHDPRSIAQKEGRHARQKVITLPQVVEDNFTHRLNTALLGGSNYPVLSAASSIVVGTASSIAGLFFTIGTTALSIGNFSQRILARGGDEIWQVEEIGKSNNNGKTVATHVLSYFLVDPFRTQNTRKAWLIHEQRQSITLT